LAEISFYKENYFQIKNEIVIKTFFSKSDIKYIDYAKQYERLVKIWVICFFVIVFDIFSVWICLVRRIKVDAPYWLELFPLTVLWLISMFELIIIVRTKAKLKEGIIKIIIDLESEYIFKHKVFRYNIVQNYN
jgi:hypothetical protein